MLTRDLYLHLFLFFTFGLESSLTSIKFNKKGINHDSFWEEIDISYNWFQYYRTLRCHDDTIQLLQRLSMKQCPKRQAEGRAEPLEMTKKRKTSLEARMAGCDHMNGSVGRCSTMREPNNERIIPNENHGNLFHSKTVQNLFGLKIRVSKSGE